MGHCAYVDAPQCHSAPLLVVAPDLSDDRLLALDLFTNQHGLQVERAQGKHLQAQVLQGRHNHHLVTSLACWQW
jgi:hypothetical protein